MALISVSSTSLVIKALPTIPAITMAFWRMIIASAFLWIYSGFIKVEPLKKKSLNRVALAGFFLGLHFTCFFWGVRNTSIANATLLGNTGPLFTAGLTFILYKTFSKKVFLSLFVALVGVFLIQRSDFYSSSTTYMGNIISLLSGFFIALVYIIAKNIRKENSTVSYGRTLFLFAATTVAIICFITNVSLFSFELKEFKWFLFLGIVPSILGHNSLNYALKYLSPTAVASIPLGEPILASILGWLFFEEAITKNSIEGAPLILIGIYFVVKNTNKY